MSESPSNPGTPGDQKTADTAAEVASESLAPEVREAEPGDERQERKDWKAEALGLKARLEEINRRERERQEQEQTARAVYPSPTTDPRMAQTQAEMVELRAALAEVQAEAASGDRRALLTLRLLEDQMQTKQETLHQLTLMRIADPDKRQRVWEHFQKNRHRLNTVDAAEESLDGIEYRSKRDELRKKESDAEAILKAKTEGLTGTHGSREVTATEAKVRKMSEAQFDNEVARLQNEGKFDEARRLMRLVTQRKVLLSG
jgi:hypothetical protein